MYDKEIHILNICINHYYATKNQSYCSPHSSAKQRRAYDDKNNFSYEVIINNHIYRYCSYCYSSKKYIYCTSEFTIDGRKSNVKTFIDLRNYLRKNNKQD